MSRTFIAQLLLVALLGVVGTVSVLQPQPFWWFGIGFIAAALAWVVSWRRPDLDRLVELLKEPRELGRFTVVPWVVAKELACLLLVGGLATAMLPDAALGDRPVTHDHPVHYFKAWQLWTDFISEGRFNGWSHRWFTGYPVPYHYPVGADLFVVSVRILSLGLLSLSQAYGVAIWLFWVFSGYAVFRLGAATFDNRWIGLVAAALYITDDGAFRAGGWDFAINWGVWPQNFAVALGAMAVAQLPKMLRSDNLWRWSLFSALLGASLFTHPLLVIHFAAVGPVALVAWAVADRGDRPFLGGAIKVITGYAVGILLAGFWLFTFIGYKSYGSSATGVLWKTMYGIGESFYQLDVLNGAFPLAMALGAFGIIGAILSGRKFGHFLIGVLGILFIFAGTKNFVGSFHLYEAIKSFQYVHFQRFQILGKPYFMVAAAYGLGAAVTMARGWLTTEKHLVPSRRWQTALQAFVVGTLIGPVAGGFLHHFVEKDVKRPLLHASERHDRKDREELVRWFNEQIEKDDRFYRIGLKVGNHEHGFYDLGTEIDRPFYKFGFTPAATFLNKVSSGSYELLEQINVRYVVANRRWRSSKFKEVKKFDGLYVYEAKEWSDQPYTIEDGSGSIEVKTFEPDEIVLEAGPKSDGTLRLHVTNYPNWHAERDGEPVQITPGKLHKFRDTAFITVPLEPGTYRFEFRVGATEWAARLATLFALLVLLGVPLFGRRILATERGERVALAVQGVVDRRRRIINVVVFAIPFGAALGALFTLAIWSPPQREFKQRIEEVHYDLTDELRHAEIGVVRKNGSVKPCRQWFDRFFCSDDPTDQPHPRVDSFGGDTTRRCIWANPVKQGTLRYRFDVPAGEALVGFYGISGRRSTPVDLHVAIDGEVVEEFVAKRNGEINHFEIPLKNRPAQVDFLVSAKQVKSRELCFNAQVVDLRGGDE